MLRTRVRAGAVVGFVMSLMFAAVVTVVQRADGLVPSWAPSFGRATAITLRVPYSPLIVRGGGVSYEHTRVIVPARTVLDDDDDAHRIAFAFASVHRPNAPLRVGAGFAVYFTLFYLASTYLRRFGPTKTRLLRTQIGLFSTMTGLIVASKAFLLFTALPEFWVPLGAVPLWCTLAFERRTAFLINVMLAFMTCSLLEFDLPLLAVLITGGLTATLLFLHKRNPREMVLAGAMGGLVGAMIYAAVITVLEGWFSPWKDLMTGARSSLLACVGGGLASGLLAYLLRNQAERLLGSVSRERLMELTDLEQPLLKKMSAEAPGSWEHARAMANLAEAAAAAIGADALLTRVGAYYHDLGKTIQPKYFVENLHVEEPSPHDELEPEVSADAIMSHVVQGTKLLRGAGIPEPVVEFAYTHHGTQTVEYFWHKCKERGNPKGLTEEFFRYPGMKPQNRETAILMLVDSIEAASRTVDPPERTKFEEMIQRVVFGKLKSGQLDESGLSVEDLKTISARMTDTLVNMFHGRIKYPWQRVEEPPKSAAKARPN